MNEIAVNKLVEKMASGEKVLIIDVREDEEIAAGKIPIAKHIPLGQIPERLDEIDKEEHYYIVCRSGGRSGTACLFLNQSGYNTTNIAGGMLDWEGKLE